jgi:hypothetical protein
LAEATLLFMSAMPPMATPGGEAQGNVAALAIDIQLGAMENDPCHLTERHPSHSSVSISLRAIVRVARPKTPNSTATRSSPDMKVDRTSVLRPRTVRHSRSFGALS